MLRPIGCKLHRQFIEQVLETTRHPDPDSLRCLMIGFKHTGTLPPYSVGVSHKKPKEAEFDLNHLVENRVAFNDVVYSAVKLSE